MSRMGRSQPSVATRGRTRSEGGAACRVRAFQATDATTLHGNVVRAERNLARTTRPLRFVTPIVYSAGTIGMVVAALPSSQSDHAMTTAALFGGMYSLFAMIHVFTATLPSAGERYERALGAFKLVPIGPRGSAGMTALWRF